MEMKSTTLLIMCLLGLYVTVSFVYAGAKVKTKTGGGGGAKGIKDACTTNEECETLQCCEMPTLGAPHKLCYDNCTSLRESNEVRQANCVNGTYKGSNYVFCATPTVTWYNALTKCCKMNGTLPTPNDLASILFLKNLSSSIGGRGWPWVGASRIASPNKTYSWLYSNSPIKTWASGNPHLSNTESCVSSSSGFEPRNGLFDDPCPDLLSFACKLN